MRFRFSLRTFFIFATLLTACFYVWLIRPTRVAEQFAHTVNREDYSAADQWFCAADDAFLADWAEQRWAFRAQCELAPLSWRQLLSGRRRVDVSISYFHLDHTANVQAQVAATPLGLDAPAISPVRYTGMFIDGRNTAVRLER